MQQEHRCFLLSQFLRVAERAARAADLPTAHERTQHSPRSQHAGDRDDPGPPLPRWPGKGFPCRPESWFLPHRPGP